MAMKKVQAAYNGIFVVGDPTAPFKGVADDSLNKIFLDKNNA